MWHVPISGAQILQQLETWHWSWWMGSDGVLAPPPARIHMDPWSCGNLLRFHLCNCLCPLFGFSSLQSYFGRFDTPTKRLANCPWCPELGIVPNLKSAVALVSSRPQASSCYSTRWPCPTGGEMWKGYKHAPPRRIRSATGSFTTRASAPQSLSSWMT